MKGVQTHYRLATVQVVTISGTSAPVTNAFGSQTYAVRVVADTDSYITFGASPTATTSDVLLPANTVEYFTVTPGQKIAFIQKTAGGLGNVTELTQ